MRKSLVAMGAVGAALAAIAIPSASAAANPIKVTDTVAGAEIPGGQDVFKAHDSYSGNGAGVQTYKLKGSTLIAHQIIYYATGTATSTGTVTLGKPNAQDIATLKGSGHNTGGTGSLAGIKGTYTASGTINEKTDQFSVKVKGTFTLP
jgi:hypothetical protein